MSLRDLPIMPDDNGGDVVQEAFVSERNLIHTVDDIAAFTERWQAVWLLYRFGGTLTAEEQSIVDGTYNREQALKCLHICSKQQECEHVPTGTSCVGMHITLPYPLLHVHLMANHFGVPSDIVLIQANGGLSALYGENNDLS